MFAKKDNEKEEKWILVQHIFLHSNLIQNLNLKSLIFNTLTHYIDNRYKNVYLFTKLPSHFYVGSGGIDANGEIL